MVSQYWLFTLFNELDQINNILREEKNMRHQVEFKSSWWSGNDSSEKDAGMEGFQVRVYGTGLKKFQAAD